MEKRSSNIGRSRRMSENGPSMSCDSEGSISEKIKPAPRHRKSYSTDTCPSVSYFYVYYHLLFFNP